MGFGLEILDLAGDKIDVSTSIGETYASKGGLGTITIEADDKTAAVALNRDGFVALRAAIDMILNADEARQSPPGRSPSTT